MDSTLAPGSVFVVMGVTVRTGPRKTKGAFSAKSRTSAMDGGNIRRDQDWTANKNIAKSAKTMASQTRRFPNFPMASNRLEMLPKLNLLQLNNDIKASLKFDRANGCREWD